MLELNQKRYEDAHLAASNALSEESFSLFTTRDTASSFKTAEPEQLVFGEIFEKKDMRRSDDKSDRGRLEDDPKELKLTPAGSILILLGEKSGLPVKDLKAFVEKFEKQSKSMHLDQTEVSETYANIAKILAGQGGSSFSAEQRAEIAAKLMFGLTPEQPSTMIKHRARELAPLKPAAYSAMIAEIVSTGGCKKLPEQNVPDLNSKSTDFPFDLIDISFMHHKMRQDLKKNLQFNSDLYPDGQRKISTSKPEVKRDKDEK